MDQKVLTNPDQFPTEAIIFSHIGAAKSTWRALFDLIAKEYPTLTSEWRYYRDGGSWLLKVVHKSKTIFWLSVTQDAFRVTFYFGDKAEPAILDSALSHPLKQSFIDGQHYGKIRGITLLVNQETNLDDIPVLINLKLTVR